MRDYCLTNPFAYASLKMLTEQIFRSIFMHVASDLNGLL